MSFQLVMTHRPCPSMRWVAGGGLLPKAILKMQLNLLKEPATQSWRKSTELSWRLKNVTSLEGRAIVLCMIPLVCSDRGVLLSQ